MTDETPKDLYFDSDGLKLHCLDWGTSGKRPLLLLHGPGDSAMSWDLFAQAMRDPQFAQQMADIQGMLAATIEDRLVRRARGGSIQAIQLMMKIRGPRKTPKDTTPRIEDHWRARLLAMHQPVKV